METYTANLYLFTDIQSVKRTKGHYMWLWELTEKSGEHAQKFEPPKTASSKLYAETMGIITASRKEANMEALINALKHFKGQCTIDLYTNDSQFAAVLINDWMTGWKESGWKNSQGKEVDERWKEIYELMQPHKLNAVHTERHSYSSWFENEMDIKKQNAECERVLAAELFKQEEKHLVELLGKVDVEDILASEDIAKSLFIMYEAIFEKLKPLTCQNTGFVKIENGADVITTAAEQPLEIKKADKC